MRNRKRYGLVSPAKITPTLPESLCDINTGVAVISGFVEAGL